MGETDVQAVKVFLTGEMYPKFNFLKRRLFSIYPRFKSVIEREELFDLIPDGKKRMDQIEVARDKLKESLSMYVKGSHSAISVQQIKTNFIISSKGTDEFKIIKMPLGEADFKENIKNIAEYPSVIVHVVENEDGKAESFERAAQSLVSLLPPRDRKSCVLCSENCKEYGTLEDLNINNSFSELDSMGKLIQSCLEDKVVKVLQQMADFIQLFLPHTVEQLEELHGQEPLDITLQQSLQKSIHEANLNREKEELGSRRDFESGMAWYLCRNLEVQICKSLSQRYGVRPSVAHEFLCKMKFDERMKEKIEENPDVFKKSAAEIGLHFDRFVEDMSDYLGLFEAQTDQTFPVISKVLRKMLFEISGVFRQAKLPNGSVQPTRVPTDLKTKILSTEGVYGCGLMCDKLIVHVKENMLNDINEIADKIKSIMRCLGRNEFVNNFEVKTVCCSQNAGITYESGKSLRVEKTQGQVNAGDALSDDNHNYGTLGCFVKGKANASSSDNYTTQLYALSCAHVFPQGCENCVEVGRTDLKYDTFGIVSQELTTYKGHTIDIAAVVVDASIVEKCNVSLKNCDGFEGWESGLHEGNFSALIGTEVYKWGSVSDLTQGILVSIDYQIEGAEILDDQYNILIETLPESSEVGFSSKGDSGSVLCFEDPVEEKVVALSMISGALHGAEDKKYICSYSCHLHTNIEELSKKTNIKFEWCS